MNRLFYLTILLLLSVNSHASVLTFDDLGYDEAYIADGYGGFNWTNGDIAPVLSMDSHLQDQYDSQNGFKNSAVSGTGIVFNGWGEPHSVIQWASQGTFNFIGAYWTSGWENQSIYFEGLSNGIVKYTSSFFQITTESTLWIQLDWNDIDQLRINNSGSHWVMDNFTYSLSEPGNVLMILMGLSMLLIRNLRVVS